MSLSMVNNVKKVSISSKRQITIPQTFFNAIGFKDEAECIFKDKMLILRPISSTPSGEFDEEILADLIKEGYSGEKLLKEFKIRQAKIRPAIEKMLKVADEAAEEKGEYMTMEDVFGGK